MAFYGLKKQEFSTISNQELDQEVLHLTQEFPYCGESMIGKMLLGKGIVVQRFRLRESLHLVNKPGIAQKDIQHANHLWHVDTNHKLVRCD